MTDKDNRRVWEFLSKDIPSGGSPRFNKWKEECKQLGDSAPLVFLQALREGTETQQNVAVVALRLFGYESKAEGAGGDRIYKVKLSGSPEWTTVVPLYPPDRAY